MDVKFTTTSYCELQASLYLHKHVLNNQVSNSLFWLTSSSADFCWVCSASSSKLGGMLLLMLNVTEILYK